jgi:hypothetical protein
MQVSKWSLHIALTIILCGFGWIETSGLNRGFFVMRLVGVSLKSEMKLSKMHGIWRLREKQDWRVPELSLKIVKRLWLIRAKISRISNKL